MKYEVRLGERSFEVEIGGVGPHYDLVIDGRCVQVDAERLGDASLLSILLENDSYLAHVVPAESRTGRFDVSIGGKVARLAVLDPLSVLADQLHAEGSSGSYVVEAPMPGLIVDVHVAPGDRVEVGTPLVVIEAMKMQNELASEVTGTVREVHARPQLAVESGAPLMAIEADAL